MPIGEDRGGRVGDAPPAAAPAPVPPAASQAFVDAVAERVLARLAPEVAESLRRLVHQEIARTLHDAR